MENSLQYASFVGLIRSLRTCYTSPHFHVIYDNKTQTVMGGHNDSETVSNHIWDVLVHEDNMAVDNVVQQAKLEQKISFSCTHIGSVYHNNNIISIDRWLIQ